MGLWLWCDCIMLAGTKCRWQDARDASAPVLRSLTPRAKVGGPSGEDKPADGRSADGAGLTLPVIDAMASLKRACFAGCIAVVTQCAAAMTDGFSEHELN